MYENISRSLDWGKSHQNVILIIILVFIPITALLAVRRRMLQQSFVGRTGNIEFDDTGNRVNADYELVEALNGSFVRRNNSVLREIVSSDKGRNKRRKKLRAVTAISQPYVFMNTIVDSQTICGAGLPCKLFSSGDNKSSKKFCCDGMAIELLQLLQADLSVDIELHLSKDGMYGGVDPETQMWNGMIGELIWDEADIVVADLTITDDRARVVDFTHPFMEVGVGVMVRVAQKGTVRGFGGFLKPVAAQLWVTVLVAIFMMGAWFWALEKIAFWIFDKFAARKDDRTLECKRQASARFSIGASLHYSWSTVVRTRDKVTHPSNTSAKITAICLALCFLVFVTTYTAQLAAFLVGEDDVLPLSGGIRDSKLQNPSKGLKIATISDTSVEIFFRTSTDPVFRSIWKHMEGNNVPTPQVGLKRLKAGEIDVLFDDYSTSVYHAANDEDCALRVVGKPFFKSGYGIALQKNSSWTAMVTQRLLVYEKFDVFLTLSHRWLKSSCDNTKINNGDTASQNTFRRMSSKDLSGVFLIVVVGVIFSLPLLVMEFYFFRRKRIVRRR